MTRRHDRSSRPAAGERSSCAVTPHEGSIEGGDIGRAGEESHRGRASSTTSRKDPGARTTRRYSLRRNLGPRMVKNPSPICPAWRAAAAAESSNVPVRSTMPFCVFESIAFAVASEHLRWQAISSQLVMRLL